MKAKKPAPKPTSVKARKVTGTVEESPVKPPPAAPKPVGKAAAAVVKKPVLKKSSPSADKPAKAAKEAKAEKKPKLKVVRDSFTMPQSEYQKIAEIKEICLKDGLQVRKSEILRAGLKALSGLGVEQMKSVLSGLDKIKTGRPNKH